jgi:hypothetical protein
MKSQAQGEWTGQSGSLRLILGTEDSLSHSLLLRRTGTPPNASRMAWRLHSWWAVIWRQLEQAWCTCSFCGTWSRARSTLGLWSQRMQSAHMPLLVQLGEYSTSRSTTRRSLPSWMRRIACLCSCPINQPDCPRWTPIPGQWGILRMFLYLSCSRWSLESVWIALSPSVWRWTEAVGSSKWTRLNRGLLVSLASSVHRTTLPSCVQRQAEFAWSYCSNLTIRSLLRPVVSSLSLARLVGHSSWCSSAQSRFVLPPLYVTAAPSHSFWVRTRSVHSALEF